MAEEIPENLEIADELIAERRSGDPGDLPDDMPPMHRKICTIVDTISLWTGRIVCWMVIPMMFTMVYEVVMRKLFVAPTMWAYDISRFLYGSMFVLGAAYALFRGVHIRADFLYRNWSANAQGRVDTLLYLFLYFPSMVTFFYLSLDWGLDSVIKGERSMDTAWMPYLGPIKMSLPIGIFFLLLQGVSETLKSLYAWRNGRWP